MNSHGADSDERSVHVWVGRTVCGDQRTPQSDGYVEWAAVSSRHDVGARDHCDQFGIEVFPTSERIGSVRYAITSRAIGSSEEAPTSSTLAPVCDTTRSANCAQYRGGQRLAEPLAAPA